MTYPDKNGQVERKGKDADLYGNTVGPNAMEPSEMFVVGSAAWRGLTSCGTVWYGDVTGLRRGFVGICRNLCVLTSSTGGRVEMQQWPGVCFDA